MDLVVSGQSVFFTGFSVVDCLFLTDTGCAGTGKSLLLKKIVSSLHNRAKEVVVTATTGIRCLIALYDIIKALLL